MVQLRELDLLGAGFDGDMDDEYDSSDSDDTDEDKKMQDAYLTPLTSLHQPLQAAPPSELGLDEKGDGKPTSETS